MKTISKASVNYLKDVFRCESVAKIPPMTMYTIIENVELTGDLQDKEIMDAYFTQMGIAPMTSEQFYARRC
jgi:hypothetical protein